MIEKILHSRTFVAYTLAWATALTLDRYCCPWPTDDLVLLLIAAREPLVYTGLYYPYTVLLFTTPYIVYSILFSGFYVLGWKPTKKIDERELPRCPDPRRRACPSQTRARSVRRFQSAGSTPAAEFSHRSEPARPPGASYRTLTSYTVDELQKTLKDKAAK